MEFAELIERRQSDRQYSDKPVEKEKLTKCLRAARMAPSEHNTQPWKYIVVDDPDLKNKVGSAAAGFGMNGWAKQAPVIIAVVLDPTGMSKVRSVLTGKDLGLLSIGMGVDHFCLQAAEIGLGTCVLGSFNESKVRKLLGVPKGMRVPMMITVGYPAGLLRNKTRKKLAEIVSYNEYKK